MSPTVNPLIYFQIFEVVIMFYAGMAAMVGQEIFQVVKNRVKPRKKAGFLMDILFWIFLSLLFTSFLYYASYGKISVHAILGFFVGAMLWRFCFYGIIKNAIKTDKKAKMFPGDGHYNDETKEKKESTV